MNIADQITFCLIVRYLVIFPSHNSSKEPSPPPPHVVKGVTFCTPLQNFLC